MKCVKHSLVTLIKRQTAPDEKKNRVLWANQDWHFMLIHTLGRIKIVKLSNKTGIIFSIPWKKREILKMSTASQIIN